MIDNETLKNITLENSHSYEYIFGYKNTLTGYDLLHGYCSVVSEYMIHKFGCGDFVSIERAYIDDGSKRHDQPFSHEYCVFKCNNIPLYVDVRGACSDYNEFMKEFVETEKEKTGLSEIKWRTEPVRITKRDPLLIYQAGDPEFDAYQLTAFMYDDGPLNNQLNADIFNWYNMARSKFDIGIAKRQLEAEKRLENLIGLPPEEPRSSRTIERDALDI